MEEWVKRLQDNAEINTRNQSASLKNLETQIEQLTKEFHTKAANDISSSSVDQCKAMYAEEKTPINDRQHEISLVSNKCTQTVQENVASAKVLLCQLPPKEMNPRNFTLPCMTKRSPDRIVENVLVKIDNFLFPSDFMIMDMLNTCNETMILGKPFLATIHAEIDVFNKEISLGIGGDRVTFDVDKKIHNFTTPIGEIYMINATSNTLSDASSRVEETNDVHNENNYCNQEQGRSRKNPRKLNFDINLPNAHFCKPVKQILKGELKFWPTCDRNMQECNGGHELYGMDEEGVLRKWYCYDDNDRKGIKGAGLSFFDFLLDLMDALPLGRENGLRFRDMIRKEVDSGRKIRRKT
ncbi:reverse transcriptase domain-containing protein [Tanacetum coccineum]|uniref:Reverse transcriptase domain-containing protein n=1 Tax=Tanacetum coccineum TaxID=301880 RepID=A0ABQ4YL25_9ASTR